MHFDERVWTDGRRVVALWLGGGLTAWDDGRVVRQLPRTGVYGDPTPELRAAWSELVGWAPEVVDAAGPWTLVKKGRGGVRLVGPRVPERRVVKVPWERAAEETGRLRRVWSVSEWARLNHGERGTVLVDPEQGLVWCLDDGVALHLVGVQQEYTIGAARIAGGFVVHTAWTQRGGFVGWVGDDGDIWERTDVYGLARDMFGVGGAVWGVVPDDSGATLARVDTALTRMHEVSYGAAAHWIAGGRWVVLEGLTVRVFAATAQGWTEQPTLVEPALASRRADEEAEEVRRRRPPFVGRQELAWAGPAGPVQVGGTIRNEGRHHTGVRIAVRAEGAVGVDRIALGSDTIRASGASEVVFGRTTLTQDVDVPLEVVGWAAGPGTVDLTLTELPATLPGDAPCVLGAVRVTVAVRGGLAAQRGDDRLALDPAWIAELGELLDAAVPEPDLGRWVRRALARARVAAFDEAPDAVRDAWLQMSRGDRERGSERGVAAHKLRRGLGWVLTEDEAGRLGAALGEAHPLGAFARGGPFEVVSEALDALLREGGSSPQRAWPAAG